MLTLTVSMSQRPETMTRPPPVGRAGRDGVLGAGLAWAGAGAALGRRACSAAGSGHGTGLGSGASGTGASAWSGLSAR